MFISRSPRCPGRPLRQALFPRVTPVVLWIPVHLLMTHSDSHIPQMYQHLRPRLLCHRSRLCSVAELLCHSLLENPGFACPRPCSLEGRQLGQHESLGLAWARYVFGGSSGDCGGHKGPFTLLPAPQDPLRAQTPPLSLTQATVAFPF